MNSIWIFLLLAVPMTAQAGLFRITQRNYGDAAGTQYEQDIDQVFNLLEDSVNALLPVADNGTFMKSMANTATLSGAANMANYGSAIEIFEAGAHAGLAIGAAAPPADGKFSLNNVSGFGAQASVRIGAHLGRFAKNLGPLDLDKAWLYVSYFGHEYNDPKVSFKFSAFSLYGQYRLYEPAGVWWNSLRWNGLNVGTGLRYVSLKAAAPQPISQTVTQTINGATVTATCNGTTNLGAEIGVFTIPLEVSTSARVLYIYTPFLGLGADINAGKSKSIANITAPVTITDSPDVFTDMSGTAILDIGEEATPTAFALRSFAGLQIELGVAALTITTTKSLVTKEVAYNAGLKIYW